MNVAFKDVAIGLGVAAGAGALIGNSSGLVGLDSKSGDFRIGIPTVLGSVGTMVGVVGIGVGAYSASVAARELVPTAGVLARGGIGTAAFGIAAAAGIAMGIGAHQIASRLFE